MNSLLFDEINVRLDSKFICDAWQRTKFFSIRVMVKWAEVFQSSMVAELILLLENRKTN